MRSHDNHLRLRRGNVVDYFQMFRLIDLQLEPQHSRVLVQTVLPSVLVSCHAAPAAILSGYIFQIEEQELIELEGVKCFAVAAR